jgi:hypothetical protein
MEPPKPGFSADNEDAWTIEDVGAKLGSFFEDKQPVKDSFIMPSVF